MRRVLADSLAGDHPDLGWQPPAVVPGEDILRAGIAALEARLRPADHGLIVNCFAKLLGVFEATTKATGAEANARAKLWIEACGDIPNDLWIEATTDAIRSLKWMPKPVELRDAVKEKLASRWRELKRARQLLDLASGKAKAPPKPAYKPPTVGERLLSSRDLNRKHGRLAASARAEREMAALEQREPVFVDGEAEAELRTDVPVKVEAPRAPPSRPSPSMEAAMLRARARFWRAQGKTEMANRIAGQADALCPLPPDERTDIPEAGYGIEATDGGRTGA